MGLNLQLLEKARLLGDGIVQARCPACAEGGGDRAGEHLRVFPDGRFGCCVHPKDREHRKRIFELAGEKTARAFSVKKPIPKTSQPAVSITSSLISFRGTVGTATPGSVSTAGVSSEEKPPARQQTTGLGTLGTPILNLHAPTGDGELVKNMAVYPCKGSENRVPSVPDSLAGCRMPYLAADGTMVIPFNSPERFHWWKGGQSIAETQAEMEAWARDRTHGV